MEQYEWLDKHYGVTEEDDFRYILVCDYYIEDPDELDAEQKETIEDEMEFLDDPESVNVFLLKLLEKYRSSHAVYEPVIPGK